jgi:hypothetical protein
LSAGTRRNGTSKTGPFPRTGPSGASRARGSTRATGASLAGLDASDGETGAPRERPSRQYAARHAVPRSKTARWAGKAAPAAVAIAATLAAGVATYGIAGGQQGSGKVAVALTVPVHLSNAQAGGDGNADAAGARKTPAGKTRPSATRRPSASPSPSRPAPPATARPTTTAQPAQSATQPAQQAAAATAPAAGAVSCSDTSSLLPDNVTAIVNFLLSNGYSANAAAGIAGNIYQESKGDPESVGMGGGGLIGWTPLQSGFVTGNPAADLQTQLAAILTYNNGWSAYLPALNGAATPADAAYIYVTDFERAGIPAASTREASADAVAAACGL